MSYKEIFPLIKENKLWLGYKFNGKPMLFRVPEDYETTGSVVKKDSEGNTLIGMGNICFFTSLKIDKRKKSLVLSKEYKPELYPKYDNYDAININKTKDIPKDYSGVMGVPISFIDKYNPDQFEIIGSSSDLAGPITIDGKEKKNPQRFYIKGKRLYDRILIKKKQ